MTQVTPVDVFPGFQISIEGDTVSIPVSALPGLDGSEAHPLNGDIRPVVMGFIEQVFQQIARLPDENKPTEFSITKGNPVGIGLDKVRQTYSISLSYSYNTATTSFEPEPVEPLA